VQNGRVREQGLLGGTVATARLSGCPVAGLPIPWTFLGGRCKDFLLESLDLLPEKIELELGRNTFTTKLGNFDLQLGDGLLLADDGLFEEEGGLLEGVNVADLLQPWHEE